MIQMTLRTTRETPMARDDFQKAAAGFTLATESFHAEFPDEGVGLPPEGVTREAHHARYHELSYAHHDARTKLVEEADKITRCREIRLKTEREECTAEWDKGAPTSPEEARKVRTAIAIACMEAVAEADSLGILPGRPGMRVHVTICVRDANAATIERCMDTRYRGDEMYRVPIKDDDMSIFIEPTVDDGSEEPLSNYVTIRGA